MSEVDCITPRKRAHTPKKNVHPIFDDIDADLRSFSWSKNDAGYAVSWCGIKGSNKNLRAHRLVLSRMLGRKLTRIDICDHINHVRLDCRRSNLRLVDLKQNGQNCMPHSDSISGIRGVTLHKQTGKWIAEMMVNGMRIRKGLYRTKEEAAEVVERLRKENNVFGES